MSEANPAKSAGASGAGQAPPDDTICFAELSGGLVVIRILGRGSFGNSVELKRLADHLAARHGAGGYHFILDLDQCTTMDSTFMGVLASVGIRQRKESGKRMTVVNANPQTLRLMKTLGIDKFLEVRQPGENAHAPHAELEERDFLCATQADVSKEERIIHMIEAHQALCDVDTQNTVRFESVLKYLHESLEREAGKKD